MRHRVLTAILAAGMAVATANAVPLTPAFTYQGEIVKGGNLVTGTADLRFTLWDAAAGGSQIGGLLSRNNVNVSNGVFTVSLDFGSSAFATGQERYLQIEVRNPAGGGAFTTLTPRQPVSATPYAVTALNGAPGFRTMSSTATSSVVLMPSSGEFVSGRNSSDTTIAAMSVNGPGGVFRALNGTREVLTGGASADLSGFLQMYAGSNGFINVLIESETGEFGESGLIRLASGYTGGQGGVYQTLNNSGDLTFQVVGGASGNGATVTLFNEDNDAPSLMIYDDNPVPGGSLITYHPDGSRQFTLEPDFSGQGAFFALNNDTLPGYITMESNSGGSALLSMSGDASSFTVNTDTTGNNAVIMPTSAVSAAEILDEPGIANNQTGAVTIPTTNTSVLSRSITVPAAGHVLVLVDGDTAMNHTSGGGTAWVSWHIDNVAGGTGSGNDDMTFQIPSGSATGTYDFATSAHAVFAVNAGTHTFHLNMFRAGGATAATLFDGQMTLIYFPTTYGTVAPSFTGPEFADGNHDNSRGPIRGPLTGSQIAAERAQSQADNMARVQAELAQMRADMEEMRRLMATNPNIVNRNRAKPAKAPAVIGEPNIEPQDADAGLVADAGK